MRDDSCADVAWITASDASNDAATPDEGPRADASTQDGSQAIPIDDDGCDAAAGGTAGTAGGGGAEMPAPVVVIVNERDGCGCSTLGAQSRFDRSVLGVLAIAIGMLVRRRSVRRRFPR